MSKVCEPPKSAFYPCGQSFRRAVLATAVSTVLGMAVAGSPVRAQAICSGNCTINTGGDVSVANGTGGDGSLLVVGGTVLAAPGGLFVGTFGTDRGSLTIRGTGSAINDSTDFTHIGVDGGSAFVQVEDGGLLSNIGPGVANPPGSPFFPSGFFFVGTGGDAQLDIRSGGSVVFDRLGQGGNASLFIGEGRVAAGGPLEGSINNGNGIVNLTGAGSRLDISGVASELFLGFSSVGAGSGALNIAAGGVASLTATGQASVVVGGGDGDGQGALSIDGAGSRLEVLAGGTPSLALPSGRIDITDGGVFEMSSTAGGGVVANIGSAFGDRVGQGRIDVDGAGSVLRFGGPSTTFGSIRVGSALLVDGRPAPTTAIGDLNITNGGLVELTATNQPTMFIGFQSDNSGVIPRGAADGVMDISGGGQFFTNGELAIGARGANGVVNIFDGGSIVIDQSATPVDGDPFAALGIGSTGGSGVMNIINNSSFLLRDTDPGDLAEIAVGYIAVDGFGSDGLLSVIGPGASFVADASSVRMAVAELGASASGAVEVLGSGTLDLIANDGTSELFIGGEGESARVSVSGPGSRLGLSAAGDATVTLGGQSSSLTVSNSALVEITSSAGFGSLQVGTGGPTPGALLRGDGLIRVSNVVELTSGGVISPGGGPADLGTLTIDGDFIAQPGGILEIDALEDGTSDSLFVTGTAALNGGTVQALTPGSDFSLNREYTILNADGGLTGEFDDVTSNLTYLLPSLTYTANSVILSLERQGAEIQQDILEETTAQELSVNSRTVSTVVSNQISNVLSYALGFGGASSASSTAYVPGSINTGLSAGDDGSTSNLWLNFTPSLYETDTLLPGTNKIQQVDGRGYNLMLGLDRTLSERVIAGAIVGAESKDIDFNTIGGSQENDGVMVGAYAGLLFNEHVYGSLNGNYAWLENEIEEAAFGSDQLIRGEFDSERYQLSADLNFVKVVENYDFRWQVGASYMKESADDYTTSAGDVAQPADQTLGRLKLGFNARYAGEKHSPYLSIGYEYDFDSEIALDDKNGFVTYAGIRSTGFSDRLFFEAFVSAIVGREAQNHNMFGLNITYLL